MGSLVHRFLLYFQRLSYVAALSLLLIACGDPEDPVVEATGQAPVVENFGVAYLKRPADALNISTSLATNFPTELDTAGDDPTIGTTPGDVYLKDLSSGEEKEINLTQSYTQPVIGDITDIQNGDISAGDVSDLEVSYDGRYLVFSMHEGMIAGEQPELQPKWNIWIYDIEQDVLVPAMSSAEAIKGNDIDPHFLPDGRIVFSSDRRDRETALNLDLYGLGPEAKVVNERGGIALNNTSYALHVMNSDGSNINQISFNQSNDLNPTVLDNGKIMFARWEGVGPRNQVDLYTINPDGTELDAFYGVHSHDLDANGNTPSEHYADFKQMPDGTLIGMFSRLANPRGRSKLISIDQANFVEYNQKRFTSSSLSATGHFVAIDTPFISNNAIASRAGSFTTPYPIYEPGSQDRLLLSWNPCRVINPVSGLPIDCDDNNIIDPDLNVDAPTDPQLADAIYSVWIQEMDEDVRRRVQLTEQEGIAIVSPVALINRPVAERPTILVDKTAPTDLDPDLELRNMGAISIKSVYDTTGSVAMVDEPLEPRGVNNLLTSEEALIPMTTIQMDTVTGNVVTNAADPAVVPVDRTVADIPAIRLSTATNTADQRVARFVRISKAVPRVFDSTPGAMQQLNGDDFGRTANYRMREILGYGIVEPDGSIYVEVPAKVPFTIDILDAKGRSLMSHTNWMQVMPGEIRVCGGCHSPSDGQAAVNIGATAVGPFPNTVNTMIAEVGETMAETRARLDCLGPCTYPMLKRDLVYDDPWTDVTQAGRAPDASFTISYNGLTTPSPVNSTGSCNDVTWEWSGTFCRIAINFPTHIQPILDAKCVACHNDDTLNAPPPGNLVLESQIDAANSPRLQALRDARTDGDRLASYEFLFISRPQMEFDPVTGGRRFVVVRNAADQPIATIDGVVTVIGETDIDNLVFINQRPGLVSQGVARARYSHLVEVLTGDSLHPTLDPTDYPNDNPILATPTVDHTTILSPEELRLLMEWIDNGTQNFNGLNAALNN